MNVTMNDATNDGMNGAAPRIVIVGAGFAGLNLLADFQPDLIKLDMDLIRGIDQSRSRQAIVRGTVVDPKGDISCAREPCDLDAYAVALLEDLLPRTEVVPLDARALVWGLGAFHCASQQEPAPGR